MENKEAAADQICDRCRRPNSLNRYPIAREKLVLHELWEREPANKEVVFVIVIEVRKPQTWSHQDGWPFLCRDCIRAIIRNAVVHAVDESTIREITAAAAELVEAPCDHEWDFVGPILDSMPPQQRQTCVKCGERRIVRLSEE